VKNVAGYDLDKLLVGSLGTLGVIVEATFKVLPQPSARGGMAARFADGSPALAAANAISRSAARPEACVVARRASGPWRLLVTASGANATVDRTMGDARREIASQRGSVEELDGGLDDARELPARATTGALVKVALPLAATAAFAVAAVRFDSFAEVVADVASGVIRIHLLGDEETVVADAGALLLGSGVVGGTGRVERREDHLRDRLPTWPSRPRGDALMRRIKEAFDPNAILERGRAAFA
jgi:glycolate oxidase FAD binding subunit